MSPPDASDPNRDTEGSESDDLAEDARDTDPASNDRSAEQSESPTLPEGHFTQVEFQNGPAGNQFFNNSFDPNLTYDFVRMLHSRTDDDANGVETPIIEFEGTRYVDADTRRTNAEIYTKVEIFRATMQYLEEFGIYLDSYLRGDRPLVTSLVQAQISDFYGQYEDGDGDLDQYLAGHGVTTDYDDRLRAVFGYQLLLNSYPDPDRDRDERDDCTESASERASDEDSVDEGSITNAGTDGENTSEEGHGTEASKTESEPTVGTTQPLTQDEAGTAVDASIKMLRSRIETIAQFYIEFRELYNAVKHGNRVIPEDGFTFEYGLAEEPIHVEEQYICAVCKTSGDHDSGRPYFLHYPADLLVTRSIRLLEWTHDLFSYLKDLHHVTRNETGEDDEEVFTLRFFAGISRIEENEALQRLFDKEDADIAAETTSQSTLETGDYIQISNPDFKAFVPRFESSITPQPPTLAARLSLKGKTIQVEAAEDDEPSPEHPLLMSFRSRQGTTARLSLLHKLDISTEYQPLDFSQYYDFIKIREATQAGEVDYIEFSVGGTEAFREPFAVNEWSLAVPDIGLSQDLIDFITRLEMATEQRIPVPLSISDEQIEILEDNHGPIGSREDALSIIDQIKSSGEKESIIHISVEYEDEHHHLTNQIGDPKLTFTTENGQTVAAEDLPGGGRDISLHYEGVPGTPDWFVDHMKANPEEAEGILHDMIPGDRDSDEEFFLTLDVDLHVQTFWYDESQIVLRPSDQPPDEVSES